MKRLLQKLLAGIVLMAAIIMPSQATDVFSYAVLTLPDDPRIDEPWFKIIRNQADWESHFYATTAAITFPESMAPVAPVLDFDSYQVISGGLGMRSSGGYYLAIESVYELESTMSIHVLNVSPGSGCLVSFGFTNPSITFLVKKTDKAIKFAVTELINQCAE